MNTLELIAQRAREVGARALSNQESLPSPCVSLCRIDQTTGFCDGCMRTLAEISAWAMLDNQGKRAVWRQIERRAQGEL